MSVSIFVKIGNFWVRWPPEPKLLDLAPIWRENATGAWNWMSNAFLFFLAIIPLDSEVLYPIECSRISDCFRKKRYFSKLLPFVTPVTSIQWSVLAGHKNHLCQSCSPRRGPSYAVYRLSLPFMTSEISMGRGGRGRISPPPLVVHVRPKPPVIQSAQCPCGNLVMCTLLLTRCFMLSSVAT